MPQSQARRQETLGYEKWGRHLSLAFCLTVALLLRVIMLPHAHSPVTSDETNYLSDGLQLIEGATSANKYAPSGPMTWFSAAYAGVATVRSLSSGSEIAGFTGLLRPVAAMEAALFHIYADMSRLRLTWLILTLPLLLWAVWSAWRLGDELAGWTGAMTSGLLAASLPLFLLLGAQTRPYATAWAFALIAAAEAASGRRRHPALVSGIWLGLAIGSFVEMVRMVPLILLLEWRRSERRGPPWRDFAVTLAAAVLTFQVNAPWYVTHFIDSVRQILSVSTVAVLGPSQPQGVYAGSELVSGGLLMPLLLAAAGMAAAIRLRRWVDVGCGAWLVLYVVQIRQTAGGIRHHGGLLVSLIALTPVWMGALYDLFPDLRRPLVGAALAAAIAGPTLFLGAQTALNWIPSRSPDQAIAWIEGHVPAGTAVYLEDSDASVLPTPEAAQRIWAAVSEPDAWVPKFVHDAGVRNLGFPRPLRVMADDRMAQDRGVHRRFYLLGIPLQPHRPRYDLWLVAHGGSFFELTRQATVQRLCRDGGVYLAYGSAIPDLPKAKVSWPRPEDSTTSVYWVALGECAAQQ